MTIEYAKQNFTMLRIIAFVFALPVGVFAALCLRTCFLSGFDLIGDGLAFGSAIVAALCLWFAARGHREKDRLVMAFAFGGALVIGGISFAAGFIGPLVFMPNSNQGPLLGIFITGPLGFTAGAVLGLCVGIVRVCWLR